MKPTLSELRRERDRLRASGRLGDALKLSLEIVNRAPTRESYFQLGVAWQGVGKSRDALKQFKRALRCKGPRRLLPRIYILMAQAWYALYNPRRMRESLRRAYSFPRRPSIDGMFHYALANWHFQKHRYADAIEECKRVLKANAEPLRAAQATGVIGHAYLRLKRISTGLRYVAQAIRLYRAQGYRHGEALCGCFRASAILDLGQPRRAAQLMSRSADLFHQLGSRRFESQARMNVGYCLMEAADWRGAEQALERAWDVVLPDDAHVQTQILACRAIVRVRLSRYEDGLADLQRARDTLPGRTDLFARQYITRAEARISEYFRDWPGMRNAARIGVRLGRRMKDAVRVAEFRELVGRAERHLGRRRAAIHAQRVAQRLREMIKAGDQTPASYRSAERLASSSLPILLVGEEGTEKVDLARRIHELSTRAARRCVVVACEQLTHVSRDLCGHVAGAWTGAAGSSPGLLRGARGGTVILDRVDALSPAQQRELVPILEKRVRPVGSAREERVDVRFVATCDDPARLVPEVRSRLAGAVLRVPPLRERREEIGEFVHAFLGKRRRITCEALAELSAREWEGNVAELKSAVERLVSMTRRSIGRNEVRRFVPTPDFHRLGPR